MPQPLPDVLMKRGPLSSSERGRCQGLGSGYGQGRRERLPVPEFGRSQNIITTT